MSHRKSDSGIPRPQKSAKVVLGRGLNCSKPNPHGCEFDEGKEASAKLIVAGSDPAVLLELVKEAFDMVALAIQSLFPPGLPSPMGAVGDVGLDFMTTRPSATLADFRVHGIPKSLFL